MNKKHLFNVVANLLIVGGAFALSACCGNCCKNEGAAPAAATEQAVDSSAIVLEAISNRTSIRAYQETPVEDWKVEKILRAGMAAPSAMNKQPWSFTVVNDKALLKQIADSAPNAGMAAGAPLAIVVCGDMDRRRERILGTGRIRSDGEHPLGGACARTGCGMDRSLPERGEGEDARRHPEHPGEPDRPLRHPDGLPCRVSSS